MTSHADHPAVLVVGSGISGLACARALTTAGVTVRVVDRGRAVGGRLATKRLDDRPVDIGARYFTVPDGSPFGPLVDDWLARGLVRPWTDAFDVIDGTLEVDARDRRTGPARYAAPAGLRSLATDLAERLRADGVPVDQGVDVQRVDADGRVAGIRYDAVVLAMPDPQAKRMLAPDSPAAAEVSGADAWQPTLSVVARWPRRLWPDDLHGAFVDGAGARAQAAGPDGADNPGADNPSAVLAFVADDGDRRGDGAPVLVAHTTAGFARQHLEHPEAAVAPVVAAMQTLLGIDEPPLTTYAHRWSFSAPADQHAAPYLLSGRIGVCGDAWGERSAVATAYTSGDALGRALGERLTARAGAVLDI
ncbi:NAD(P)/FAD-dependent oxidoreductase [Subtercola sp. YIM 133946]|uniref:NAD(P)/FAD-dependent oxidoreductase n=1 Tax=Subtercola sp. YIM 133946 TaxID=3118909 RepID=UPI002F933B37